MRLLRSWAAGALWMLLAFAALTSPAQAQLWDRTTPTEAAAMAQAKNDHTAYTLPPAKLAMAEALKHRRYFLYVADTVWGLMALLLILELGAAAWMRSVANRVGRNPFQQAMIFLALLLFALGLLDLPLAIYAQHVERAYGLSIQSWAGWVADHAKSFALALVLDVPAVVALFWLVRRFPRRWWFPAALSTMLVTVLGVFWYPYVIDPLFNRFEPLSATNPALVAQLERVVARQTGFAIPPDRMFLMRASDKVTTLNAYVTGFGPSKRVVVWDNSIAKGSTDEVLLIFGHEMGHYVLAHVTRGMLFSFPLTLAAFWAGSYAVRFLLRRFGLRWRIAGQDDWAALVVMMLVLEALMFLSEPIQNSYSRSVEHAADVYGMEVVHGIVANPQTAGPALEQLLGENSYTAPDPSPFIVFWASTHPPTWLRASFEKHYDPWAPGAAPKYFSK